MDKIKKQIKKITGDLNAIPKEKEQTILTKLVCSKITWLNERVVKREFCDGGIESPAHENPKTVFAPLLTLKLFSSDSPPDAPDNIKPVTSNWKPIITVGFVINTSTVCVLILKLSNDNE